MLTFTAVHGEFDRVAVGAMEGLVSVQDDLHVVFPRLNIAQIAHRVPKRRFAEHDRLARMHRIHIHPKHHLRLRGIIDLEARLGGWVGERTRSSRPSMGCSARALLNETEKRGPD